MYWIEYEVQEQAELMCGGTSRGRGSLSGGS